MPIIDAPETKRFSIGHGGIGGSMSKLSVNHLASAMQSLAGAHFSAVAASNVPLVLSNARLASLLAPEASGGRVLLTVADLGRALRDTFDLERDRIVADAAPLLDLPTVPTGRGLRLDPAHSRPTNHLGLSREAASATAAGRSLSAAETFATASGLARARDLWLADHWIVLVLDARSLVSTSCQEQIAALAAMPRILVLWCEIDGLQPLAAAARNRETLEAILARAGLAHIGPLSGVTGEELVAILQALKVMGKASLMMLRLSSADSPLDAADLSGTSNVGRAGAASRVDGSTLRETGKPANPSSAATAIEAALLDAVRRDTRVVVVDIRPAASLELSRGLDRRYLPLTARDGFVWQRCIGLAAGGCRPVVLMNERHVLENATALAGLPAEVELNASLVVFADVSSIDSRLDLVADLPAMTFAASDLDDFERLLSRSFLEEGLTIITPPQSTSSPGMQLRFDSAQSFGDAGELQAERQQILAKRFSSELAPWIAAYEQIGERNGYIWKWCLHGVELTTLDSVRPELKGDACDTKVLAGMLNVLVDDVADQLGQGDLLGELLKLIHHDVPQLARFATPQRRYAEFTCEVWAEVWRRAKRYPCYDPYAALLQFDLAQLFNTVHYSHLVNSNPYILNVVEHDDYSPQGMGLLSFAMIDLMCSPEFSVSDLGRLREVMWHAQWMARIGNLMTTWQREVNDRDYTSGVFAHAVSTHDLTVDQLLHESPAQITEAITRGGHEDYFLRRWRAHRAHFQRLIPEVQSVDLAVTLRGLDRLLQTELVSRGSK